MVTTKRAGFSLIEVMVALVILVIGLIGIFNLHIVAKRSSFESFQQTQAAYLANDILSRMKLNRTVLASYAGKFEALGAAADSCDTSTATCNPTEMKNWDLYQWRWLLTGAAEKNESNVSVGGLDTPVGCISIAGDDVTIAIAWQGIRETKNKSEESNCDTTAGLGERRRLFVLKSVINAN